MTSGETIHRTIRRARSRAVLQLLADQLGWGAAAALSAFIVMLLAGTQVLAWYWPPLLLGLTVTVLWLRTRRRLPDDYAAAQRLDRALALKDLLSTCWHYRHSRPSSVPDARFVQSLESEAVETASRVDPGAALPVRPSRSTWVALVLLVLSGAVFTVRYGVLRTFDLRPPIAEVRFDTLTGAPETSRNKFAQAHKPGEPPAPFSVDLEGERAGVTEADSFVEESLRTVDVNDPSQLGRQGKSDPSRQAAEDSQDGGEEASEEGDRSEAGDNTPSASGDPKKGGDRSPQNDGPRPKDSSLMEKMRDALASLMEKLKIEPKGLEQAASKSTGQKGQGKKQERGTPSPGKPREPGDPDAQRAGDQQAAENMQTAQNSRDQQGQEDPSKGERSGIGKSDGKKDTELAEMQEALGKLSEILGHRAKNIQGEVMVEVSSSKNQQLKTPYVSRSAAHSEAGGEIGRDEIPLHLQEFVGRYYERIRKSPPAPAAPKQ